MMTNTHAHVHTQMGIVTVVRPSLNFELRVNRRVLHILLYGVVYLSTPFLYFSTMTFIPRVSLFVPDAEKCLGT